jgi:hypothetical protein
VSQRETGSHGELGKGGSHMGLFSVRGRLSRPVGANRTGALAARFAMAAHAAIRDTGDEISARVRDMRLALVAATDDAKIVGVLLMLAAVALALEMAASFHLI